MVRLAFWKMHGLGNDYVVIDNRDQKIEERSLGDLARALCKRRFSVGADGLLLLYKSSVADLKMRIFNPDGTEAEMCGNGIRCIAKYCYENGVVEKEEMTVETLAGVKSLQLKVRNGEVKSVRVDMGKPSFERRMIPMLGEGVCIDEKLEVEGETYRITCLSMGNPHCVIFVEDSDGFPVKEVGPRIESHKLFPNKVNVEFVEALDRDELKVRVWERGVGETLACGTGACAAVAAGVALGIVDRKCTVHLLGGDLQVEYGESMLMTGPAEKAYEGIVDLEHVLAGHRQC